MSNPNLDYLATMLTWIENTSSKNAKLEGLRTLKRAGGEIEKVAMWYFRASLDWYCIYHIGSLPEIDESKCQDSSDLTDILQLQVDLETGEYRKKHGRDVDRIMSVLHSYNAAVARWLRRMILKDLDCGVQSTTVGKVWPGLVRTFECQLADTISDIEALKYPLLLEPKIDGVRALAFVTPAGVTFMSRGGQVLSNVDHIGEELMSLLAKSHKMDKLGIVIDGELYNGNLHSTLGVVRSSVKRPDRDALERVKFNAFDALGMNSWKAQQCNLPQSLRTLFVHEALQGGQLVIPVQSQEIKTSADVESQYRLALDAGYEGVMLKSVSGMYAFDRSKDWLKYKPHEIDTFEITGYYEGEGRLKGMLGGIMVKMKNGSNCLVGGGYSDSQRQAMWATANALIGFKARVKYKEASKDGKLREPVFLGLE